MAFKKAEKSEENIAAQHREAELNRRKVFQHPKSVIPEREPLKEANQA